MLKKIILCVCLVLPFSVNTFANDLYNTPVSQLKALDGVEGAELEKLLSQTIAKTKLGAALKEYSPEAFAEIIKIMAAGVEKDMTLLEITAQATPYMEKTSRSYLPYGDDKSLVMFSNSLQPLFRAAQNSASGCEALMAGDYAKLAAAISAWDDSLTNIMSDAYIRALKTYDKNRPMPGESAVSDNMMKVMTSVVAEHGTDFLLVLENTKSVEDGVPCRAMADLYKEISGLPEHEAAELLRYMLSIAE